MKTICPPIYHPVIPVITGYPGYHALWQLIHLVTGNFPGN